MQYMLIHAIDENAELDNAQLANQQAVLDKWIQEVVSVGVDLHGSRLRPTAVATTVKVRNGQLLVTDGPFAETREQVAGYDVLECAGLDEALAWAARRFDILECADIDEALKVAEAHPMAKFGMLEVRPFWPFAATYAGAA
ncbi:MAG TPA: YciI family protein [Acidimicrobiales bacterium]|nr:YciI family protein [Acidimicrobiales bacterium]